ncbi:MAG: nuclear transport factor 2 family protein [Oscillospiraceae bacterium]|nr:nuclear transport factor 2 family protein [Oscillospiraceae bacterium]
MTDANLEALTHELQRQMAIHDCKNLIGKVMYYGVAWLNQKLVELWSQREDCLLEMPWGIYDGRKGVERCYLQDFGDRSAMDENQLKGIMMLYTVDTPIVEVAEDGQTAKGVWVSSGADTWREGDEHPQGYWRWGKYAVDFILEDGVWKIWHMRFYPFFLTKYDVSWTEAPAYDWAFFPVMPDRPRETPVYHYDGQSVYPTGQPAVPAPYAHYE